MNKFDTFAFANTIATIDIVLHPFFHLWVYLSAHSYEWAMNLFVAGLQLEVTSFDSSLPHIILGTFVEASVFWLLGYSVASIYNRFSNNSI